MLGTRAEPPRTRLVQRGDRNEKLIQAGVKVLAKSCPRTPDGTLTVIGRRVRSVYLTDSATSEKKQVK